MRLLADHPTTTAARRLAGFAALPLLLVPLAACGGDDPGAASAPAGATSEAPAAPVSPVPDPGSLPSSTGSSDGGAKGGGSASDAAGADPQSPFVVAATAVATRSRDQVTQLHVMGLGTTAQGVLPRDQLPALAENIRAELGRQVDDARRLPPPDGTPAADLVAALQDYRRLTGTLASWDPDGPPLGDDWFRRLATVDQAWKSALRQLGQLGKRDLLADLAPLPMPS